MFIVVGGAGEVGYNIAMSLVNQGHEVAMVDKDPDACRRAEGLDIMVITGNVASPDILKKAYIESANIFVGVTGSDEVNLLACAVAKTFNCSTVARVNSFDYINAPVDEDAFSQVGVDIAVCPDLVAATKMARIMTLPSILDAEVFADGRVQVLDARVESSSKVVGNPIRRIKFPRSCNVVAIFRDADIIVPTGDTVFMPQDQVVTVLSDPSDIPRIQNLFGNQKKVSPRETISRVMIVGATRIGLHLARLLQDREVSVILIDKDEEVCENAAAMLPRVLVLHGRGTDRDLLLDEDIVKTDAFLATTEQEEFNTLSCLLAKQLGAYRTIALIDKPGLRNMLQEIGVDVAVSPRQATVSTILQHAHQADVMSFSVLHTGDAVAYEIRISEKSKIAGKRLKNIRQFFKSARIGVVIRDRDVMIPRGEFVVQPGDRVVVFTTVTNMKKLESLFK